MKKGLILLLILALVGLGGWYYMAEEEPNGETEEVEEEVEENENEEVVEDEETEDEEIDAEENQEQEEEEASEEDVYEQAETVVPMSDRNVTMDEDFREMFEDIFEQDLKLTKSDEITALRYVAPRVINDEDVTAIRDLIEEDDNYTIEGFDSEGSRYEINVSTTVNGQEYNNNVYLNFYTDQEGERAQVIEIKIL